MTRLGRATFDFNFQSNSLKDLRSITLAAERSSPIALQVESVTEFGVFGETTIPWIPTKPHGKADGEASAQFASEVNIALSNSASKDIYVYVHGVKSVFENPILVIAQFWHFLGYDGLPVAYSWPSIPKRLAYASDIETAVSSARNLRIFLNYLAHETHVERIHIVGYSAGTRLVTTALSQIALSNSSSADTKIGNVVLVSRCIGSINHLFVGSQRAVSPDRPRQLPFAGRFRSPISV